MRVQSFVERVLESPCRRRCCCRRSGSAEVAFVVGGIETNAPLHSCRAHPPNKPREAGHDEPEEQEYEDEDRRHPGEGDGNRLPRVVQPALAVGPLHRLGARVLRHVERRARLEARDPGDVLGEQRYTTLPRDS